MNLFSPSNIKELLLRYGTRPSKRLGQNFLIDKNALERIIKSADIKPINTILEVGPGIGTLTQELAKRAEKVIAVEKDETMVKILAETISNHKNVEVINADILKLNPKRYTLNADYKVVANIPYYLTSPLIRKFLESESEECPPPKEMILMLQKEVAQRICASPPHQSFKKTSGVGASHRMSLLAVSVQFYADAEIISYVSKNCFWPAPKVDSAIIKITPRPDLGGIRRGRVSASAFFRVVKAGFSQPRKQLAGNLSKSLKLDKDKVAEILLQNCIEPERRAETLGMDEWLKLAGCLKIHPVK